MANKKNNLIAFPSNKHTALRRGRRNIPTLYAIRPSQARKLTELAEVTDVSADEWLQYALGAFLECEWAPRMEAAESRRSRKA